MQNGPHQQHVVGGKEGALTTVQKSPTVDIAVDRMELARMRVLKSPISDVEVRPRALSYPQRQSHRPPRALAPKYLPRRAAISLSAAEVAWDFDS